MQLNGQQTLPVSQAQAWAALNDIEMLKASIAGCESLVASGENEYEALLAVSIGPVKARFKGKLKLSDLRPPSGYQLAFEGSGGAAGHGKGSAQVRLETLGPAQTLLHYTVVASVGGKIAQLGSRLVDMAAQKMANDFFASFTEALRQRHAAPAPAEPPPEKKPLGRRFLDWYLGWLGRIFKSAP
ncbi:CoxG family protein [Roseateles violae]|uniref:Carbon monoxide dehydrogenase subunit G n=1 Tax=Roseateles violae TaxID=3058042 RepID=A0ABT8DND0_9BURK|nr:carbon monoxide dehydrogenase subunit G [Pelomonas sp. PFR6]MDN3919491.1 carbon monoxide dehydrogenase subunit G [Pelomonas sp. PFR6]